MVEVLAPVGSISALKSAIFSGADAVYMGMGKFNARQKAENFTESNIKEVVDLCHLHAVKVYITFNTAIKNSELKDFEKQVDICAKANVDAFIITDIGTLPIFRKYDIPMHASTQMGIHNYEGAKIAKELGFTRVVLSREALIEDIKKIKTLGLEIEYFVHGALCVAFSGGCLLSSFMSGDSGNRGLCKQPCRLKYKSSITGKEDYYISPSDQCLITHLKELTAAGVDSLKIEGRLKGSQYVGEVVKQYRQAVDGVLCNDYMTKLKRAYNRGNFTSGYNYDLTKDIMSPSVQGNMGDFIGTINKIQGKSLYIESKRGVFLKDGFKIFNNNEEIGGFQVDNVKQIGNNLYSVNTIKTYPVGSKVYLTLDSQMVKEYENPDLSQNIDITYRMVEGENLQIRANFRDVSVTKDFEIVDKALGKPLAVEDVNKKLSELGETDFRIGTIKGEVSNSAFYPMSKLKAAKRDVVESLYQAILKSYDDNKQRTNNSKNELVFKRDSNIKKHFIETESLGKLSQNMTDYEVVLNLNKISQLGQFIIKNDLNYNNIESVWLKIPKIARGADIIVLRKFIENNLQFIKGFVIENIYGLELCLEYDKIPMLGSSMNVFNDKLPKELGVDLYLNSLELTKDEYIKGAYTYVYGPVSLMTFTHCPIQLNTGCTCKDCKYKGTFTYSNRGKSYTVARHKLVNCYFEMYHPSIIDIKDRVNGLIYENLEVINPQSESFSGHYNLLVK